MLWYRKSKGIVATQRRFVQKIGIYSHQKISGVEGNRVNAKLCLIKEHSLVLRWFLLFEFSWWNLVLHNSLKQKFIHIDDISRISKRTLLIIIEMIDYGLLVQTVVWWCSGYSTVPVNTVIPYVGPRILYNLDQWCTNYTALRATLAIHENDCEQLHTWLPKISCSIMCT
jgi:hypothetical protein